MTLQAATARARQATGAGGTTAAASLPGRLGEPRPETERAAQRRGPGEHGVVVAAQVRGGTAGAAGAECTAPHRTSGITAPRLPA